MNADGSHWRSEPKQLEPNRFLLLDHTMDRRTLTGFSFHLGLLR